MSESSTPDPADASTTSPQAEASEASAAPASPGGSEDTPAEVSSTPIEAKPGDEPAPAEASAGSDQAEDDHAQSDAEDADAQDADPKDDPKNDDDAQSDAKDADDDDDDGDDDDDDDEAAPKGRARKLLFVLGTPLFVALVLFLMPRKVNLVVDNHRQAPLRVFVNGKEIVRIPGGSSEILMGVPAGQVQLKGVEVGPSGQDGQAFELNPTLKAPFLARRRAAYIWNVQRSSKSYWVFTNTYGNQRLASFPPKRWKPPEAEVFQIPARFQPTLNGSFPALIPERNGVRLGLFTEQHVNKHFAEERVGKMLTKRGEGMLLKAKDG